MDKLEEYRHLSKKLEDACKGLAQLERNENGFWDKHNRLQAAFKKVLDGELTRKDKKELLLAAIMDGDGQFDPVGIMALAGETARRDEAFTYFWGLFKKHVRALKNGVVQVSGKKGNMRGLRRS